MNTFTNIGYMVDGSFDDSLDGVRALSHSGMFHSDDATGVAILSGAGVGKLQTLWSRLPVADTGEDVTLDVGVAYDVGIGEFDPGQRREGVRFERFERDSRAAAGLTWSKYGVDFVRAHYSAVGGRQANVEEVARRVHSAIIADVDTIDTGEFTLTHFLPGFNAIVKTGEYMHFSEAVIAANLALKNAVDTATEEVENEAAVDEIKEEEVSLA